MAQRAVIGNRYRLQHFETLYCHPPTTAPAMSQKSLALIGNSRRAMYRSSRHLYSRGFSITRLEGSRWRLRRTRAAMEKVRECGLKSIRDERCLITEQAQR